ncbi:hypothetical protein DOTSEDRAFT_68590 [Dothistroma septosporum NZE10]|uniref:Uncharacterized protein n=1 Tax=Dothistroma septosporum (strain NZE10 / CBS 128990) TaxID=675120 RepID=N1Q264_DOTSN|nr:hypothetical protein DOTSEDRAFT_68590 [Dothistroma septosporum NZE10]
MPNARPPPLDLNRANTRRVPKLAVRNRSPAVVSEGAQSSQESNNEAPHSSLDTEARHPSGPHSRQNSSHLLRPDHRHSRHTSKAPSETEQQYGRQAGKKKGAGVLGFLTLREPSTSAFEEFAEQERKKAAQKNLKLGGVTLPGVSSQRLPDHVPKVNSKWDGLPDFAKRKLDKDREREKFKRGSVTSLASNGSGDAPRRSYGSLSSKPAARQATGKGGPASRDGPVPVEDRPDSAISSNAHPPLTHTQGQSPNDVRSQTMHQASNSPATFALDSQDNAFELDLSDVPNLQEHDYSSGSATSPEASPRTPAFDVVTTGLHYSARTQSPAALVSAPPRRNGHLRTVEGEDVVGQISDSNSLGRAMMQSTKGSGRSLFAQVGKIMPLIKETSDIVRIDSRTASPEPAMARKSSRPACTSATPAVSAPGSGFNESNGKASPAAAAMGSAKNDVLPWDMFEPPLESVTNIKGTSEFSKLKRFSKLGRK